MGIGANWSGSHTFAATVLHEPTSIDELQRIVAGAAKIHALGSRHCFNDIADSAELVSLARMPRELTVNADRSTVTIDAGMTYGELGVALERAGLAIHNMASLPHISVAGAVATATHGSGDRCGNLSTAVAGMELVTSSGDIVQLRRGDADFNGAVVHLGALGVVTRLTLDVEPSYRMAQQVFRNLAWDAFDHHFDELTSAGYSVSFFTDYGETIAELWIKDRVDDAHPFRLREHYLEALASDIDIHPVPRLDAANCTVQRGEVGCWADRLPHFRVDAVPASGNEIQTEFMIGRQHAVQAVQALRLIAPHFIDHIWTAEIRTVAADDLWMSTAYGHDIVCLHFSWFFEPEEIARFLPIVQETLTPFSPRPHWGKVNTLPGAEVNARYPKHADFIALANRLDPRGAFRNDYLERTVFA
jgi:xylitol oxidase